MFLVLSLALVSSSIVPLEAHGDQDDFILIDSPLWDKDHHNIIHYDDPVNDILERHERDAAEGSGELTSDNYDYPIDDDEDHEEVGSADLVSSRTVPSASSPVFIQPVTPKTVSSSPSTLTPPSHSFHPARPGTLSSYYPTITKEGSGGDSIETSTIESSIDANDTSMISPSRPQNTEPSSSWTPSLPPTTTEKTNHKPFVTNKLEKIPLTAGKASRILIPANTFQDLEDGDTRDLSLKVVQKGTGAPLDDLDWIRFDPITQEIVALPLEDDISSYEFEVVATDSGGLVERDLLKVAVRQHASTRLIHHTFEATLGFVRRYSFKEDIDWKISVLDSIMDFYGDSDPGSITVLSIVPTNNGDVRFTWTNDSLPKQSCPRGRVQGIFNKMVNHKGTVTPSFRTAMKKNFYVKDVALIWKGLCATRGQPGPGTVDNGARVPDSGFDNDMPQIRNPVDKLNVTAGELLQYQVMEDMCFDAENGGTRDLNLQLLTNTQPRLEVPRHNWLQFDTKNQEFYGVPLEGDVGRDVYQLVCSDSQGLSAYDGIEVVVTSRPFAEKFNLEFTFVFNDTLDDGNKLAASRVKLVKTLARIFNDADTRHIVLKSVDPDTLEVMWVNKSLPVRQCPHDWLKETRKLLMDKEGRIRPRIVHAFAQEFHLADIRMIPMEACATVVPPVEEDDDQYSDPIADLFPAEYFITFIVPAVIIVTMLLLAILIACLLHRKRKAGKLDMFKTEALPPRIPVIMQDELCEDNYNLSKQPIILQEEPGGYGSYGNPPQYYAGGNMRQEDDFNECDSLVNGSTGAPASMAPYARPPPVALDFSDTMTRSRHRPAPAYRKTQPMFNP